MSRFESITIRKIESSDLETFYEHQLDPGAIRMAAFVSKDPKDKVAFDAYWDKILNSSQNTTRTIVSEGQVAGHMACYKLSHLDIDGALVGGASFEARSFDRIVPAARLTSKTAIREDAIWSRPTM